MTNYSPRIAVTNGIGITERLWWVSFLWTTLEAFKHKHVSMLEKGNIKLGFITGTRRTWLRGATHSKVHIEKTKSSAAERRWGRWQAAPSTLLSIYFKVGVFFCLCLSSQMCAGVIKKNTPKTKKQKSIASQFIRHKEQLPKFDGETNKI